MRRWLSSLVGLSFVLSLVPTPAVADEAKLVISQKKFALESDPELVCDGMVNGYITLPAPVAGRHRLESVWIRPDGVAQESSAVPVDFATPRQTARVWLQFGSGGLLSSLRDERPDGGAFNGEWRLKVRWDDKDLIEEKFKVRC